MDFNRFKVMVDETTVEPQPLLTPAMTVCVDPVNLNPDILKMFALLSISAGQPQSAPTQSKHNDRDGTLSKLIFSWIS